MGKNKISDLPPISEPREGYVVYIDVPMEVWHYTSQLRNVERVISSSNYHCEKGLVLQQLHQSSLGNAKWVDVPIETE